MVEKETITKKKVFLATRGGKIVAGLQHSIVLANDYSLYLASNNSDENARRQSILKHLQESLPIDEKSLNHEVDQFMKLQKNHGCEIHIGISNDFMDAVLLNEDLCNLPYAECFSVKDLG